MEHEWNGKKIAVMAPSGNVAIALVHANPPNIAVEVDWAQSPSDADKEWFAQAMQLVLPVPFDGFTSASASSREERESMAKRFVNSGNN